MGFIILLEVYDIGVLDSFNISIEIGLMFEMFLYFWDYIYNIIYIILWEVYEELEIYIGIVFF